MAHRIYRLSIVPDAQPAVRRVIDFDGRASLADVHLALARSLGASPSDERMYGFFLSGLYWDRTTEYVDPRAEGRPASGALLFRLGLRVGQHFVYARDSDQEWQLGLTVTSIEESPTALPAPLVVESVGELVAEEPEPMPDAAEVERIMPFALAVLGKRDAASALELAAELRENRFLLISVEERLDAGASSLLGVLFELGLQLANAGSFDDALSVTKAFSFMAPSELNGDLAIILAMAGRREEALAQVEQDLADTSYPYVAERKAGDTYRALGELDSAEAYYRRALIEAKGEAESREALVHFSTFLIENGREADARVLLENDPQGKVLLATATAPPVVGRNDPCSCGSGKKYKKCHGA